MGALIGLIFGGGLALVISSLGNISATPPNKKFSEKYWPTFCDDLSAGVRAGLAIPAATWQASESLPLALQQQFLLARQEYESGGSFVLCLEELAKQLDNQTFFRIVNLILTAQNQNTAAVAGLLNEQAHNLRADLALMNEILGKQAVTRVSAKVAAFAPLVVLALTSTRATVRDAYFQPLGIFVLTGVFLATAVSYFAMRNISQIKVLTDA